MHNFGNAGSQTPRTEPTNESSSSSDGETDDSDSDERNDIECTYRGNEAGANELDASSADSGDSDTDKSNDIEDNNDNFSDDDSDEDEAEKTVEDYIREMTFLLRYDLSTFLIHTCSMFISICLYTYTFACPSVMPSFIYSLPRSLSHVLY